MADAQINVPGTMAQLAKDIQAALPTDIDFALIAYSIAAPEHPLMVSQARPSTLAAVLKRTVAEIEEGAELKAEREEAAQADPAKRENTEDVLAIGWAHFAEQFLPPMVPVVQRVEMKKAWMSGCVYLFNLLNEASGFEPHVTSRIIDTIQREMAEFAEAQAEARKHR